MAKVNELFIQRHRPDHSDVLYSHRAGRLAVSAKAGGFCLRRRRLRPVFAGLWERVPYEAKSYLSTAREYAKQWASMADDGDHYRVAFDRPGTWSQKHNLIWDRLLGLDIFPGSVAQKETALYVTKLNRYGLPCDNRAGYSLVDWTVWTAALSDAKGTFETLIAPIYRFADESPDRVVSKNQIKGA